MKPSLALLAGTLVLSATLTSQDDATIEEVASPALQSIGPIAFGPANTLFVSDPKAATIHAFAVADGDAAGGLAAGAEISDLAGKIAARLGTEKRQIRVVDMAIDPATHQAYFAVIRGRGENATPVVVRTGKDGKIREISLAKSRGHVKLPDAATDGGDQGGRRRRQSRRMQSITDLGFVAGKVVVAGLSNEEFSSTLRQLPWPFDGGGSSTSVEIFHGAHGRYETYAPVRTFAAYDIGGATHILAAYTCTPLVVFPVSDLKPGKHVKGRTVAELGNRNNPLDMIVYDKGGKDYLLIANSSRGVMKVPAAGIAEAAHIEERVSGGKSAGMSYDTIKELDGVVQLAKLDDEHAVVLVRDGDGGLTLKTIDLP